MLREAPLDRIADLADPTAGLSSAEVADRAARYGDNRIVEAPPSNWRTLLRETLKDPMLWFLIGTSALGMDAYLHRAGRPH